MNWKEFIGLLALGFLVYIVYEVMTTVQQAEDDVNGVLNAPGKAVDEFKTWWSEIYTDEQTQGVDPYGNIDSGIPQY